MERAGAMRYGQCVARAGVVGEFLFELPGLWPGRDPSGAQRVEHFTLLIGTDRRAMKRHLTRRARSFSRCDPIGHMEYRQPPPNPFVPSAPQGQAPLTRGREIAVEF